MDKQLLIADTQKRILKIYENNQLLKTIDDVWIGQNGVTSIENAKEGMAKTPLGMFKLGLAFGIHDLKINYPYIKLKDNYYWVDDYKSPHYNYFISLKEKVPTFDYNYIATTTKKDFSSAEHLIEFEKPYEYAVFIEFNCQNQIKNKVGNNKGSAIFLHCHGTKGYTGGCLAVKTEDMKYIIEFLDKDKNPQILIK